MPVALRAPGLIFGGKIGSGIDIWSFGCLIYEIITGTTLFCVSKFGADEQADDDHLVELNNIWNRFWTLGWKKNADDGEGEDLDEAAKDLDHNGEGEDFDGDEIEE